MDFHYSFSPAVNSSQSFEYKKDATRTVNKGKNIAFSIFLGASLLATPCGDISRDIPVISNYSPVACISYVSINSNSEVDLLNSSYFIDLLKIDNLKKIECMSVFHENWNGVGGQAFSTASINIFREIIENVCKQPNIAPTGRNSLLLQYESDDHSMLAFEVREKRIEMVHVPMGDYSSATCEVFTDDYIQQINSQVAKFYGLK